MTALMIAISPGHEAIVDLLLQEGANGNITTEV